MSELNPYQALSLLIIIQTSFSIKVRRQRKFQHQSKTKSWPCECQNSYIEQTSSQATPCSLYSIPDFWVLCCYRFYFGLLQNFTLCTPTHARVTTQTSQKAWSRCKIRFNSLCSFIMLLFYHLVVAWRDPKRVTIKTQYLIPKWMN